MFNRSSAKVESTRSSDRFEIRCHNVYTSNVKVADKLSLQYLVLILHGASVCRCMSRPQLTRDVLYHTTHLTTAEVGTARGQFPELDDWVSFCDPTRSSRSLGAAVWLSQRACGMPHCSASSKSDALRRRDAASEPHQPCQDRAASHLSANEPAGLRTCSTTRASVCIM